MSIQNYNRLKEAIKIQGKALKRLESSLSEVEDEAESMSKYF